MLLDLIDARGGGAAICPHRKLPDRILVSFGEDFYAAVRAIFHPPREPEPARFALSRSTEKHPLYATANDEGNALVGHRVSLGCYPRLARRATFAQ